MSISCRVHELVALRYPYFGQSPEEEQERLNPNETSGSNIMHTFPREIVTLIDAIVVFVSTWTGSHVHPPSSRIEQRRPLLNRRPCQTGGRVTTEHCDGVHGASGNKRDGPIIVMTSRAREGLGSRIQGDSHKTVADLRIRARTLGIMCLIWQYGSCVATPEEYSL